MRLGIVGTGFIAESHAAAARSVPEVEVAGVTDVNPAAAAAFSAKWGAQVYDGLDDLVAGVDAVILCTPNDLHEPMALKVLAGGRHLLLEKPMALTSAGAERIRAGFAEAGLTLLVGHTHRHSDYARAVRQVIADGGVGQVRSLRIAITGGWIWAGWNAWVLRPEKSGGHAFHNGVHLYDLAVWWADSPCRQVYATGQTLASAALELDDYLSATLVLESGATAICEISRGEHPKSINVFEIVVHGSEGTVVRSWTSDGLVAFTEDGSGPRGAAVNDAFVAQLHQFAAGIAGKDVDPSPAAAVHATAVAEAVQRSATSGRVEEVSL